MKGSRVEKIMAAFAIVIGSVALAGAIAYWVSGETTRGWSTAEGELTKVWVERRWAGSEHERKPRRESHSFAPRVRYRYSVGGKHFEGHRLAVHVSDYALRSGAAERLTPYQEGRPTSVFYDPNDPSQAVLETGWEWHTLGWILGASGLAFFFGFAEIASLRSEAREEARERPRGKEGDDHDSDNDDSDDDDSEEEQRGER